MSKRTAIPAIALALVIGAAAGFAWHVPGKTSTWSDVRTWVGFAVIVVGAAVALIQLDLQRRQLASQQDILQGEVERNKRRDQLLDKQLEELDQRARILARQQAEKVDLRPTSVQMPDSDPKVRRRVHAAEVANSSRRPIRDISCRIQRAAGDRLELAEVVGLYVKWLGPGMVGQSRSIMEQTSGTSWPLVRAGDSAAFMFDLDTAAHADVQITVRFTDDAGLHWQIDHDLHLTPLADRSDW